MPRMTAVTPAFIVSTRIEPGDVAELARQGVRTLLCNLPDQEVPARSGSAAVAEAAKSAGIAFVYLPVNNATLSPDLIASFQAVLDDTEKAPVVAYCQSGGRSYTLWAVCQIRTGLPDGGRSLAVEAASRGYDIGSAPMIARILAG